MRTSFIALYLAPFLALGFSLPEELEDLNSLFNYDELIQENRDNSDANYITIENSSSNYVDIESICKVIPNGVIFIKQEDVTINCKSLNSPGAREKREDVAAPEEGSGSEDLPNEAVPIDQVNEVDPEQIPPENTSSASEEDNQDPPENTSSAPQEEEKDEEGEQEPVENISSRTLAFSPEILTLEAVEPTEAPEEEEVEPSLHTTSSDFVKSFSPKDNAQAAGDTKRIFNTNEANNASDVGAMETSKASKDTKILVFLFVAVVAVGVAAFGYNFVKKRKQRSNEVARVENGTDKAKNSSNSNSNNRGEEEMKEMKPLMEKPQKVDVVDEREESGGGVASTSDNNPSSSAVPDVKT